MKVTDEFVAREGTSSLLCDEDDSLRELGKLAVGVERALAAQRGFFETGHGDKSVGDLAAERRRVDDAVRHTAQAQRRAARAHAERWPEE